LDKRGQGTDDTAGDRKEVTANGSLPASVLGLNALHVGLILAVVLFLKFTHKRVMTLLHYRSKA
jgi:hypothetical protein